MRLSVSVTRTRVPVSLSRFGEPVGKKIALVSLLNIIAAASVISAHADELVYEVRLENGAPQHYRLEVPSSVSPVKVNPSEWNQPQYATNKISPNAAVLAAVGWAGGLEDHDRAGKKGWGGAETKKLGAAEQKEWGGSEEKTTN